MPLTIPPELKKITPYVRRAEELDRDTGNPESRLVSYYCLQYAVHTGISLATSPDGKRCLGELLGKLEGEKQTMDSFTRDEAKFLCKKFADKIFDKADIEDRAGEANKMTAKTFYAAASFLEILQQFYEDNDESEEVAEQKKKSVYSKWKATEILKAIKEGRTPTPGGYVEDNDAEDDAGDEGEEEVDQVKPPCLVETVDEKEEEVPTSKVPIDEKEEETLTPKVPSDDTDSGDDEGTEVVQGWRREGLAGVGGGPGAQQVHDDGGSLPALRGAGG